MDDIARRYADRAVRSVFLYTREAHPGEHYRHHTTMADKRANASAFQTEMQVERQILLDDVAGTAHRAYGTLPNMTWIFLRGGLVVYKSMWTDVGDVESALNEALKGHELRAKEGLVGFYSERLAWRIRDDAKFREGLVRAGPQAVSDFYPDDK